MVPVVPLPCNQFCAEIWHEELDRIIDAERDGFADAHAIDKDLAAHLIKEGYEQAFLHHVWPAGNS